MARAGGEEQRGGQQQRAVSGARPVGGTGGVSTNTNTRCSINQFAGPPCCCGPHACPQPPDARRLPRCVGPALPLPPTLAPTPTPLPDGACSCLTVRCRRPRRRPPAGSELAVCAEQRARRGWRVAHAMPRSSERQVPGPHPRHQRRHPHGAASMQHAQHGSSGMTCATGSRHAHTQHHVRIQGRLGVPQQPIREAQPRTAAPCMSCAAQAAHYSSGGAGALPGLGCIHTYVPGAGGTG